MTDISEKAEEYRELLDKKDRQLKNSVNDEPETENRDNETASKTENLKPKMPNLPNKLPFTLNYTNLASILLIIGVVSTSLWFITQDKESRISSNAVSVNLSGDMAQPSRPVITQNQEIEFRNNEDYDLEIRFDDEYEDLLVPAGESRLLNVTQITYYEAVRTENPEGARPISGSINVQN